MAGDEEPARATPPSHEDTAPPDDALASTRAGMRTPQPTKPELPTRVGRHVVIDRIGKGGMGVVLSAYDPQLDRKVAIKLLHATSASTADLVREAQALAKLSDPHVVAIYDVGELARGSAYIAMEYVEGTTLRGWLRARERGWREIVAVFVQAGLGLAAAHAIGLVHRDFKPDNVLVGGGDRPRARVADFGLARHPREPDEAAATGSPPVGPSATGSGRIAGTPAYMAPEQLVGAPIDARADQFAFCVALHEALYREPPFPRDDLPTLVAAVSEGRRRPPPRGSGVPQWLERAVARGLATEPSARFPDMHALIAAISRDPGGARRRWSLAGLAVLVAIATPLAVLRTRDDPAELCREGAARIDETWNDARAAAIRSAFDGLGTGWASSTAENVVADLDAWAEAWRARVVDVCDATHVRREQSAELFDLRMQCLAERRTGLAALVDVLEVADAEGAVRASNSVAALASLARCDDVEALRARVPLPEDPAVVAEIAALRASIAHVLAEREAGSIARSLELGRAALADAERIAYAPALAEALVAVGAAEEATAAYDDAERHLHRAALLAVEAGDDGGFAEAAAWLVWVFGELLDQPNVAHTWGELGLATVAAAEVADRRLEYRLRTNLGSTLTNEGRYDEAEAMHRRALELARAQWGDGHPRTLAPQVNLAAVALHRGDDLAALEGFTAAYELALARLGPVHPSTLLVRGSQIAAMIAVGRWTEAEPAARAHLAALEQELGPEHPDLAVALHNLARIVAHQQRYDEELALFRRALELRERAFGKDSMPTIPIQQAMVITHRHLGDLPRARALAMHLDEVLVRNAGADSPHRITVLAQLGNIDRDRGELTSALAWFDEALRIAELAKDPDSTTTATMLDERGTVLRMRGELEQGLADHRRALALFEANAAASPVDVAECRDRVAQAEAELAARDRD